MRSRTEVIGMRSDWSGIGRLRDKGSGTGFASCTCRMSCGFLPLPRPPPRNGLIRRVDRNISYIFFSRYKYRAVYMAVIRLCTSIHGKVFISLTEYTIERNGAKIGKFARIVTN